MTDAERAAMDGASTYRHCPVCASPRLGPKCHKCGSPTREICDGWEWPAMPPVDLIRELARDVGYAIGEHGTKERDLDLIAAPWTEDAVGNAELIDYIASGLGARVISSSRKPLGRYAASIQMNGWFKVIDLSVCPAGHGPAPPAVLREVVAKALHDRVRQPGFCSDEDAADATLSAISAAGYVIVPREPTPEMVKAGVDYRLRTEIGGGNTWAADTAALYRVMVRASKRQDQ